MNLRNIRRYQRDIMLAIIVTLCLPSGQIGFVRFQIQPPAAGISGTRDNKVRKERNKMSILKYVIKYTFIGGLVLLFLFGISQLVLRRSPPTAEVPRASDEKTPPAVNNPRGAQPSVGGHFHADGTWHADAAAPGTGKQNLSVPKQGRPTRRAPRQNAAHGSSLGWITWKYGGTTIRSRSPYRPDWTPLPQEIKDAIGSLEMEREAREVLNQWVQEAKQSGEEIDVVAEINHPVVGYTDTWPDAEALLLDAEGNLLPPFTESEYAEEKLRRLVGDRDLEEATQFLAQHGHYDDFLVSQLSDEQAFEYLYAIGLPLGNPNKQTRLYAERVVSADPDHLKARLYLADTSPRSSASDYEAALDQYESILIDHSDSAHAWIEAGNALVNLERPFQSVAFLQQGHELGARQGHYEAGIAYQQLGDYKMAWVSLRKALQVSDRSSHQAFGIAEHLEAIEMGMPLVERLPIEQLDIAEEASVLLPPDSDVAVEMPPAENAVPPLLEPDISDDAFDAQRAQARAAAEAARRQEIERLRQLSQQEIKDFIEWAEQLMREEAAAAEATDFLATELAAHLTGKPAQFSAKRIVRANELIKRYGYEEGLSRIIPEDPELAIQIQLSRKQEPIPKQNKKEQKR